MQLSSTLQRIDYGEESAEVVAEGRTGQVCECRLSLDVLTPYKVLLYFCVVVFYSLCVCVFFFFE